MAESSRIEDLRRRIQKDPASIAFAQLAEELRRAGNFEESVEICRAGLAIHPGYLSARVTLGRALVELSHLDDAQAELEHVLASAPENLAAIRGLAEINHRNGDLAAALSHYRAALALAKNDPDLQETVSDLAKKVDPPKPPASADGLTLEQATRELSIHVPPPVVVETPAIDFFAAPIAPDPVVDQATVPPSAGETSPAALDDVEPRDSGASTPAEHVAPADFFATLSAVAPPSTASDPAAEVDDASRASVAPETESHTATEDAPDRAPSTPDAEPHDPPSTRVIPALEQWLEAIHVTREHRGA